MVIGSILDTFNKWWRVLNGSEYQNVIMYQNVIIMRSSGTTITCSVICDGDFQVQYIQGGENVTETYSRGFQIHPDVDTEIRISTNAAIHNFVCSYSNLTDLQFIGLKELVQLSCSYNELTVLNVSGLVALRFLGCTENELRILDCTGLKLDHILCSDTPLDSLVLTDCSMLQEIQCQNTNIGNSQNLAQNFADGLPSPRQGVRNPILRINGTYAESIIKPTAEAKGWNVEIA